MSVGSEIGRIPLNPQRPSRARSTENRSRVKYVVPLLTKFFWFSVTRGPWWKIRKFKSIISRGPRLKIRKLHSIISVAQDEKSGKLSQQKVSLISLASAFPYCGLGRGVVGSEGRFPPDFRAHTYLWARTDLCLCRSSPLSESGYTYSNITHL